MDTHAWAELPERPNQPRYISVVSDAKGYYCVYHYLHPPDNNALSVTGYRDDTVLFPGVGLLSATHL